MINYNLAYYRRNNKGQPTIWYGVAFNNIVEIYYGILGKTITNETIKTNRGGEAELKSRIASKRKSGYKMLSELSDSNTLPVEEVNVLAYLETYLSYDRTTADGNMLPMLAKLYDNKNNKMFNKGIIYGAQFKINGLRCFIGAKVVVGDMFKPIRLTFQSREGTMWNTLTNLEDYLLKSIPLDLLNLMVEENYILDGELYLPEISVNDINHFVKNDKVDGNKNLQFWCYDIAIDNMSQDKRLSILDEHLFNYQFDINCKETHYTNTERLVYLQNYNCSTGGSALALRNMSIDYGFEGIILRDLNVEYQYGKRNSAMWKYKSKTDGKFVVIDIKSEGDARPDIPLITLRNDINDATFDVHVTGGFAYQKDVLVGAAYYIGRTMFVEYGERSGVKQVPFHVISATFVDN